MTERSLAHIEKIINVHPIPKADRIVMAEVLGWQCVVGKDAKPGDLVVYIEIDSLVPDIPVFKFMESRHFKVRTARFMKQISQGLAMPLDAEMIAALGGKTNWKEGDDVTDLLKITKYDPEVTDPVGDEPPLRRRRGRITSWFMQFAWFRWVYLKLFGPDPKGTFPSFIPKTDETRIQNYTRLFEQFPIERTYVSEKLEGQSGTWYVRPKKGFFGKKWEYGVASRNLSVAPDGNTNWARVGRMLELEKKLIQLAESIYPQGVAIQGEIVGPGIQGNIYQRPDLEMYVFNIYDLGTGNRVGFGEMVGACKSVGLKTVPILNAFFTLDHKLADLLEYAEGKTVMDMPQPCEREGVVIRTHDQKISFKVVSNTYLLGKTKKEETEEKAAATAAAVEKPSEEQTPKSPS